MNFKIVWLGKDNEKEQTQQVEKMLSAMHTGNIRLGAKKTNGFGQFALKVCKREYDLKKQADREESVYRKRDRAVAGTGKSENGICAYRKSRCGSGKSSSTETF